MGERFANFGKNFAKQNSSGAGKRNTPQAINIGPARFLGGVGGFFQEDPRIVPLVLPVPLLLTPSQQCC